MSSGEPDDAKVSRPVRRGVCGKVPARQLATFLPYTKLYGKNGGLLLQSAISVAGHTSVHRMRGLRCSRPPMRIETDAGSFYVGEGSQDWGRPVESMDFHRLASSPEMLALFLGTMTHYGVPEESVSLMVGLPLAALMGEDTNQIQAAVRQFLRGEHHWQADGISHNVTVESVRITSQPVGAMFDYLLTDEGNMPVDRRSIFKHEIGILSIGMNTVELLVVRGGALVQRFSGGETVGVRRLLDLLDAEGHFSRSELDARLRAGSLEINTALPIWESEVMGFIERQWGSDYKRFRRIILVGGGILFLRDTLLRRFRDRAVIPDNPIMSTVRGLYKYALSQAKRGR
mgnify:CR=1 FL=1